MLPLYGLTTKQLCNMYDRHKKQSIFRSRLIAKNESKTDFCSVCKKRNTRIDKGVLCPSCCFPIHRKCCNLKNSDIIDLTRNQAKWHWECSICISLKSLFNLIDDKELIWENFNSNYNCKYLTTSEYEAGDSKYIFHNEINDPSTDKAFSNLIDENNYLLKNSFIQPNFKFYQNHKFHKLVNGLS